MTAVPAAVRGEALRVVAVLCAVAGATAIIVAATCAGPVRALLGFGFGGVSPTPAHAVQIFLANARLVVGVLVGTLLAIRRAAVREDGSDAGLGGLLGGIGWVCDLAIGGATAVNVVLVGAAFGAYGTRMVGVVLPHGPVEVAAYGLVLDLYLRARHGRTGIREWAIAGTIAICLLALAAALETFA